MLDALKDPVLGYFDPRDKYTAIPDALISEEPYANFVVDDNNTSLAGMRIGIVGENLVKPTLNDGVIVDQVMNEYKTVLRDKLGAELVESIDPLNPNDDPTISNMEYTFQDALAEILPLHMPEYLSKTNSTGDLEFVVPGWNVTTREYMAAAAAGEAPWPDNLNFRRITSLPLDLSFSLAMTEYLLERGDAKVKDWASLNANSKWFSDARRAAHENWASKVDIRSDGITEGLKMRYVMNLVVEKVMKQNDIDVFVGVRTTLPPAKNTGPAEPPIPSGRAGAFPDIGRFPEIIIPGPFNQVIYEPKFQLSADKKSYITVTGTEQSTLPNPLPIGMMFWAGPGDEPALLKVSSAYESATHHRIPPPDFGPLPTFPVEHMSNSTASAGYGVYAQKPARAEYVTNSSQLVGDEIDSITLRMKSVGTINGTAEIGILNEDLSVKKLFGTLDVSTLTPTYTDYEFNLTGGELYTIESGDRIGIKYEGGGFDETSWVSVMLDLNAEDPFDGANSYLQYHYQGSWRQSPDRDMYMTLQQTHG